jgi:O-antigen ligase
MTAKQAKTVELTIVGVSLLSLLLLFQPFSLGLYSVGAGLVVLAGLAFNLVPLCTPGRTFGSLLKGALVIAIIFVVVTLIALGSALLYAAYLKAD